MKGFVLGLALKTEEKGNSEITYPIMPERGEVGGHWWGAGGDTGPSKTYYWLFFVFFSIATTQERKCAFSTPSVVQ